MIAQLTINVKVVIRHVFAKRDSGTPVVSQMEDSGLDTQPVNAL